MALTCPRCGRQYDVTLFEFRHSVACECGAMLDLQKGHLECLGGDGEATVVGGPEAASPPERERAVVEHGQGGAITPATWDYIAATHIAQDYDRYFAYNELFQLDTEVLARWMPTPGRLLDLGCGTGRHVVHFAARGFEVTGVDLSEHMLSVVSRKLSVLRRGATLVHGDITRLDELGLGRFDYIICMFSTLGMIYGAANRARFLRQARGHLRGDGLLAFHVHNRWHNLWYREGRAYLWRALRDRLRGRAEAFQKVVDGYRGIRGLSLYVYGEREIRGVVAEAGFRVEELLHLNRARDGVLTGLGRGLRANGFLLACRPRGGPES